MKRCINEYIEYENYYKLIITNTKKEKCETIFSKEDFNFISQFRWSFSWVYNSYRIRCTTQSEFVGKDMSTVLFNNKKESGFMVDHINRNSLDNRRDNLRLVTQSINAINAKPRIESKSKIRGVYKRKERPGIAKAAWICEWSIEKKRYSKSFSIEKYGEEQAFELACKLREEKINEMKI